MLAMTTAPAAARARLRLVPGGAKQPDDAELVAGLRRGESWARDAFFDRYAPLVERTLRRVLGRDVHTDLADLIHDAFVQALESIARLREPEALPGFVRAIAANVACNAIRSRQARRWLRFWEPSALPDVPARDVDPSVHDAYVRTYAALDRLGARERTAFALRHIEGLELTDVADACGVSLATVKRVLRRAEERFVAIATGDPVLRGWLEEGGRWTR